MKDFFGKYWFFLGIGAMILLAFGFPAAGKFVKEYKVLKVGIFIAFLITGLKLETRSIIEEIKNFKGIAAALVSTFVLVPLLALVLAKPIFASTPDFVVGACIIAVAPVTVASGTVLTGIAGGNIPLSLFICVASNFLSIFTIPFSLQLLLQFGEPIDLPVFRMIQSLLIVVLLPTVIGQLLRIKVKEAIAPYNKAFSIFSQCIVLLIIFNAVASSTDRIFQLGFRIIFIFLFMIFLHSLILLVNFGIARLIRLNRPSISAFTIHTSQKTLTVSYIVWSGYFATAFPLGLVPAIGYHLTQMVMDTVVAHKFKNVNQVNGPKAKDY